MKSTLKLAKRAGLAGTVLFLMGGALSAGPLEWRFELTPGPDIVGPPGSTISWGYSITNEDPDFWLVPLSLDADLFQHGTPNAIFDYPILGPGQTVTGPLYELAWDPAAPLGFVNSGRFTITSDYYSDDPFNGGFSLFLESQRDANYTATVGDAPIIPEPATGGLLVVPGMVALVWWRCFRRS